MQNNLQNCSQNELFNLAYEREKNGVLLYSKFSDDKIFTQILEIKKNGVKILKNLAEQKDIALKNSTRKSSERNFINPPKFEDKIIVCLNYELESCEFYKDATELIDDDEIKDLFFRLWATSNNEYIVALKQNLNKPAPQKTQFTPENIGEFLKKANLIASGNVSKEEIAQIMQDPNFPFFSGIAAGGVVGLLIDEILQKGQ